MDAVKQLKYSTIDDIYNLSDGQRAELIDGKLYMLAAPTATHQRLVMVLSNRIYNYIQGRQGMCEVFPFPFAVFLNANNEIYLEPDISVICDKDKLTDLIITKSVSRFARNTVDSLSTIRRLKDNGTECYFEKENI